MKTGEENDSLLGFIESVAGDSHLRVEENLGSGYVRLRSSEAERRQAKHDIRSVEDIVIELLRNARDANAGRIYLATTRDGEMRAMTVIDDGDGIPESMHAAIFEPRVTSKLDTMSMDRWGVHGRGMALFSIKSNVSKARVVCSGESLGASIRVDVDTALLPEKADQSTAPQLERGRDGKVHVARGPHNISRNVVEFALESQRNLSVYLGSPAEIVATLVDHGDELVPEPAGNPGAVPVCNRLADCGNAVELVEAAASIGLTISERNAHRILGGQIAALRPHLETVLSREGKKVAEPDIFKDSRALKIAKPDLDRFSRNLESAFESIAAQYYLMLADEPIIKVGKDSIKVTFPIEKE